jgi:hypothetical protein
MLPACAAKARNQPNNLSINSALSGLGLNGGGCRDIVDAASWRAVVCPVEFPQRLSGLQGTHKSMPLNQPASTADLSQIAASTPIHSSRGLAAQGYAQHLALDARKIKSAIGFSGFLVLAAGAALALVCTAWSVQSGVAYPIAVAAGYCMLVCSACLCIALAVILNSAQKIAQVSDNSEPNYAAWNVVKKLRVSDASRLWCNIEPGCAASQESLAWAQAMFNAIKSGELPFSERMGASQDMMDRERINPSWATEIERAALKRWAATYGHAPRFLQG